MRRTTTDEEIIAYSQQYGETSYGASVPIEKRRFTYRITHDFLEAKARIEHLEKGIAKESFEVEQILAQALGHYPWYCEDQKNFPGTTKENGVCVGEHVPASLALEAANTIKRLREEIAALKEKYASARTCLENVPDIYGVAYQWLQEHPE